MSEKIAAATKSNCHLHLTGALPPTDLRALGTESGVPVAEFEPLEEHIEFEDPVIWAAAKQITSHPVGLLGALRRVIARERADNVTYLEITMNPYGMMRRGMEPDVIASVAVEAAAYGRTVGTEVKYKYGVNRKDGPSSIPDVTAAYRACPQELRRAIDLNGDERRYPTDDFVEPLGKLVSAGIPVCVHAGENPGTLPSLEQAMRIEPFRIAHAVAAAGSLAVLRQLSLSGTTVEVAPTSNLHTGAIESIATHPLPRLLDQHVAVVLGNDDPAFFGTTMTDEWNSLRIMGFSEDEVLTELASANIRASIDN